jgi:hypothetical protein
MIRRLFLKSLPILLCLLLTHRMGLAQKPDWKVNVHDYQYSMTFVSFLNINGTELSNQNDMVAAFVGDECRGVTSLVYIENQKKYYAFLTVFSNLGGENISFRIYQADENKVVNVDRSLAFEIDGRYGDLFQSFSIAQPALSNRADILSFSFSNIDVIHANLGSDQISLDVPHDADLTNLIAVFDLSDSAELFSGSSRIISGTSSMDYSKPVELTVRSADQSIIKNWQIIVNKMAGLATFYKKDAVCYKGGAIKVVYTSNLVEAILHQDNIPIAWESVVNNQAVFDNLEPGTYTVRIAGYTKTIDINLKQ